VSDCVVDMSQERTVTASFGTGVQSRRPRTSFVRGRSSYRSDLCSLRLNELGCSCSPLGSHGGADCDRYDVDSDFA
jgi:hypothetical protein